MTRSLPTLFGPYGRIPPELLAQASDWGVNASWFHGFAPEMFDACDAGGVSACVEFKTFRADFLEHPELIPIGVDGQPIRYGRLVQGICLSQTEYLDGIEEELRSGLRLYQPAGVWLDYLTYAGWFESPTPDLQESCFCDDCIREFCYATDVDAQTPAEILQNHAVLWTAHKCGRVASYAEKYARIIRELCSEAIVGAYMCPYLPEELDGALARIFAQDYARLSTAIDIFTPLIYARKSGRSPSWGREFLEASPGFVPDGHPVQLILDFLDFPESLRQTAESKVPSHGIQLFGGGEMLESEDRRVQFSQMVASIRSRLS